MCWLLDGTPRARCGVDVWCAGVFLDICDVTCACVVMHYSLSLTSLMDAVLVAVVYSLYRVVTGAVRRTKTSL